MQSLKLGNEDLWSVKSSESISYKPKSCGSCFIVISQIVCVRYIFKMCESVSDLHPRFKILFFVAKWAQKVSLFRHQSEKN